MMMAIQQTQEQAVEVRENLNNWIKNLIKWIPLIVNVWILLILTHAISDSLYPFLGQSLIFNFLLYLLSHKYRFCVWHRVLIVSMSLCVFLEFLCNEKIVILTRSIDYKITIILLGLLISLWLYLNGKRKRKTK